MKKVSDLGILHPHPVLSIDSSKQIVDANRAAMTMFSPRSPTNECCHEFLFGLDHPCDSCCLDTSIAHEYTTQFVTNLQGPDPHAYTTSAVYVDDHGRRGCFKSIHPPPSTMLWHNFSRSVMHDLSAAQDISSLVEILSTRLSEVTFLSETFRVRHYQTDSLRKANRLRLVWHDSRGEPPQYVDNLSGRELIRDEDTLGLSFYAIEHFCVTLITPNSDDVVPFCDAFKAESISICEWDAGTADYEALRLYLVPSGGHQPTIFDSLDGHRCLDIPLGTKESPEGKLSITPGNPNARFSKESIEQLITLQQFANSRIATIRATEDEKRRIQLGNIHDAYQPSYQAINSIAALQRIDDEKARSGVELDKYEIYLKKNLAGAIRMIAFLTDAPNVSRDIPCAISHEPINLLSGVLAPIVNMFRHTELLEAQNREEITSLTEEDLADISVEGNNPSNSVKFSFGRQYEITYDGVFSQIRLMVDEIRLQELFYNLLTNASKYRDTTGRFRVRLKEKPTYHFQESEKNLYRPFHVIDVSDNGLGFKENERQSVFSLGERGSASQMAHAKGTGRGLYLIRELLLSMGGDIYIHRLRHPTTLRLFIPTVCKHRHWVEQLDETKEKMDRLRRYLHKRMPPL